VKRRKRLAKRRTAKKVRSRRTKQPAVGPRTFEEVRDANLADPFHAARIARVWTIGERFDDPNGASDDRWAREVFVHPDCEGGSHWMEDEEPGLAGGAAGGGERLGAGRPRSLRRCDLPALAATGKRLDVDIPRIHRQQHVALTASAGVTNVTGCPSIFWIGKWRSFAPAPRATR
jgi:hypothetical protein